MATHIGGQDEVPLLQEVFLNLPRAGDSPSLSAFEPREEQSPGPAGSLFRLRWRIARGIPALGPLAARPWLLLNLPETSLPHLQNGHQQQYLPYRLI